MCVYLSPHQKLSKGWKSALLKSWDPKSRLEYRELVTVEEDFKADFFRIGSSIHPRSGVYWKYPIKEKLVEADGFHDCHFIDDLFVYATEKQSEDWNLTLTTLMKCRDEYPGDSWIDYQIVLTSLNLGLHYEVLETGNRIREENDLTSTQRSVLMKAISESQFRLGYYQESDSSAKIATELAPDYYEAWHWRAVVSAELGNWRESFNSAIWIEFLKPNPESEIRPSVWKWWGFDSIALASYKLGNFELAVRYGHKACAGNPLDKRLKSNLVIYESCEREDQKRKRIEFKPAEQNNVSEEFEIPPTAMAGSEVNLQSLINRVQPDPSKFNIIKSVCSPSFVDKERINVLWQHHNSDQSSVQGLKDQNFVDSLDAIVFVSHWQYQKYMSEFKLPLEKCFVIRNAIEPIQIDYREWRPERVRLIYTSTPWRGLDVLLNAFEALNRDDCELEIYSSCAAYGRQYFDENDYKYNHLYERARSLKNVSYKRYVPRNYLFERLRDADIFAYPNHWEETFCMSAVEAGASGLQLLVSNLGALPEVLGENAIYVPYSADINAFSDSFRRYLDIAIDDILCSNPITRLEKSKRFNEDFSWNKREKEWQRLLSHLEVKRSHRVKGG